MWKKNITSYTEEAITEVIPANVGDEDIKKEVLNIENILYTSWFEIISFIESKEVGRHVTQNFRKVSAVSSF